MANTQLIVLACLAVLAACAVAAPNATAGCQVIQQNQAGTLKSQTPKNCLASPTVKDQLAGVVEPKCFDSVKMNLTNTTGAACTAPSVLFNVSFADPTCFGGEMVGGGEMMAAKNGSTVKGEFLTGQTFTGTSDPSGLFTVAVKGFDCEISYATKNVGKPNVTTLASGSTNATSANGTADNTTTSASKEAPATAAAPTKSSAAAAAPAVLLALLAGAMALAF